MNVKAALVALLVAGLATGLAVTARGTFGLGFTLDLEKILIELDLALSKEETKPNPFDWLLQDLVPQMIGSKPANQNGTKAEFRAYAMMDESNDDAYRLSLIELIARSGFRYEVHDCIADDGYITGLYRLVNPLADRAKLRYPPILIEHGGTIDPTAYFIASSIQHHPEPWPRTAAHGPFTSWNRSLAFTLSNHGFDVWLAETRGANDKFKRKIKGMAAKTILTGENHEKNMTKGENIMEIINQNNYWSFTQDDIIAHELKSHMDCVTRLSGSEKLHVFTFSLSTPSSLAFLSIRPDYADKIRGFVSMSPIISGRGVSPLVKLVFQGICPFLPDAIGTLLLTDFVFTQPFREVLVAMAWSKFFRYSFVKAVVNVVFGPSAKYQTLLELNVMGHLMRQLSFKELKQMCQQTRADKLQKFDYGPIKNKLLYNSTEPPVYDLSKVTLKDWIVVSGANDELATLGMVDRMNELLNPENRPIAHIVAPGFNHLDMIAAVETDKYVNLPILNYLIEMSDGYGSKEDDYEGAASARSLDVSRLLPHGFKIGELDKTISNITAVLKPDQFMSTLQKSIMELFEQFSRTFKLSNKDKEMLFGSSKSASNEAYKDDKSS